MKNNQRADETVIRVAGVLLLAAVLVVAGCSVDTVDEPASTTGTLSVSAMDTVTSEPIVGAEIRLDGTVQSEQTPAVIDGLDEGSYQLEVRPGGDYSSLMRAVEIVANDTTEELFRFGKADTLGTLIVSTDKDPAEILVDEKRYMGMMTPDTFKLAPGNYSVSVYRKGHRTLFPALDSVQVIAGQQNLLTFQLAALQTGKEVGNLAPDFKFPTDGPDSLTLSQFRGRPVLITFWFYT